ncbi:transcription factor bHLH68-like isoform X2 [Arachis stenosperma]|uniref:transcription factor bHLH68-like isoform X2 n=1 Tax=Arachis stenosperma TaxID=217475 RepID=UPI0025AD51EA|nr:transcription factor bHLH68-like isoform X2 [Arachis stenosperma]
MMAGNPNNWWSMNPSSLIPYTQYVLGSSSSSSSIPFNPLVAEIPEPSPQSWSQLLFTGLPGEEERLGFNHFHQSKKLENWDDHNILINNNNNNQHNTRVGPNNNMIVDGIIKQEVSQSGNLYGQEEFHASNGSTWSTHMVPINSSSPRSSVTTNNNNNNNLLDFSYNKVDHSKNQLPYATPQCNSTSSAGICKKAKGQSTSSLPPLKVRKEKLGDRITALHQLVSPFGKALSSPYLGNGSKNMRSQQYVHGERNSVFPEDPGQLLNDTGLKRKAASSQDSKDNKAKDLRSRGLCLVPVSFTQHVGNENGADFWAPAYGSGF